MDYIRDYSIPEQLPTHSMDYLRGNQFNLLNIAANLSKILTDRSEGRPDQELLYFDKILSALATGHLFPSDRCSRKHCGEPTAAPDTGALKWRIYLTYEILTALATGPPKEPHSMPTNDHCSKKILDALITGRPDQETYIHKILSALSAGHLGLSDWCSKKHCGEPTAAPDNHVVLPGQGPNLGRAMPNFFPSLQEPNSLPSNGHQLAREPLPCLQADHQSHSCCLTELIDAHISHIISRNSAARGNRDLPPPRYDSVRRTPSFPACHTSTLPKTCQRTVPYQCSEPDHVITDSDRLSPPNHDLSAQARSGFQKINSHNPQCKSGVPADTTVCDLGCRCGCLARERSPPACLCCRANAADYTSGRLNQPTHSAAPLHTISNARTTDASRADLRTRSVADIVDDVRCATDIVNDVRRTAESISDVGCEHARGSDSSRDCCRGSHTSQKLFCTASNAGNIEASCADLRTRSAADIVHNVRCTAKIADDVRCAADIVDDVRCATEIVNDIRCAVENSSDIAHEHTRRSDSSRSCRRDSQTLQKLSCAAGSTGTIDNSGAGQLTQSAPEIVGDVRCPPARETDSLRSRCLNPTATPDDVIVKYAMDHSENHIKDTENDQPEQPISSLDHGMEAGNVPIEKGTYIEFNSRPNAPPSVPPHNSTHASLSVQAPLLSTPPELSVPVSLSATLLSSAPLIDAHHIDPLEAIVRRHNIGSNLGGNAAGVSYREALITARKTIKKYSERRPITDSVDQSENNVPPPPPRRPAHNEPKYSSALVKLPESDPLCLYCQRENGYFPLWTVEYNKKFGIELGELLGIPPLPHTVNSAPRDGISKLVQNLHWLHCYSQELGETKLTLGLNTLNAGVLGSLRTVATQIPKSKISTTSLLTRCAHTLCCLRLYPRLLRFNANPTSRSAFNDLLSKTEAMLQDLIRSLKELEPNTMAQLNARSSAPISERPTQSPL